MFSLIRYNLFLSGADDKDINKRNISHNKIDVIFNLAPEVKDPKFDDVINDNFITFKDEAVAAFGPDIEARDRIIQYLNDGKNVLVHCKKGKSRSPHVIALVLEKLEDKKYKHAYKEVRGIHPDTLPYSIGEEQENKGLKHDKE